MSVLLASTLFTALAYAVAFKAPAPTPIHEDSPSLSQGWTPSPTKKAELFRGLKRRAVGDVEQLGFEINDNTCGYLAGLLGASKTCDTTETCFVITSNAGRGVVGCGDATSIWVKTSCVNSHDFFYGTVCGDTCRNDGFVLQCTDATAPYCNGYYFTEWAASFYSCDNVPATTLGIIETTFSGEDDGRTWSAMYYTSTNSGVGPVPTSNTANNTTPPPNPHPSNSKPNSNIGWIVGGVIGGLAVIGLLVFGIVWMCLRRRRQQTVEGQFQPPPQAEVVHSSKPNLYNNVSPTPTPQSWSSPPISPAPQYSPRPELPVLAVKNEVLATQTPVVTPPQQIQPMPYPNAAQLDGVSRPNHPYGYGTVHEVGS